ncbi:MAG: helix-turn-helix domain-containing protein [Candidatus Izemoplasmatales bacterium]|nr:helix-turn-helix domain-containing protein [Candidatus Izemoplasmatales bacterium]
MERRILYLYIKGSDYEEIIAFLKMYDKVFFKNIDNNILIAQTDNDFTMSDFYKLREFILEDLLIDFVGLYVPKGFTMDLQDLKLGFESVNFGTYDISNFITEVCLEKENILQKRLKSYYYNLVGIDNINTVISFIENNFNASLTSKKLFLHRNTLNYRLENFTLKTEMDIKKFQTGLAIYLLFKR